MKKLNIKIAKLLGIFLLATGYLVVSNPMFIIGAIILLIGVLFE